ncbi:hypothetical protein scyTo_0020416 [Scyliorhinus torazame]|uniref:Deoxynucleotidyltransferase terminal-interacting protein 1 n=1 Tax=Scyliorhinus torazame TaxID=75743 RepID=A0A401PS03_SCYTO|nr:hypothetical protein [Scyliorhinus torazame]
MAVSFTNPNISMDLLRTVLQPHINEEIRAVINKYTKAKMMYSDGGKMITKPIGELSAVKRSRQMEDDLSQRGSPIPKKRKGRPPGHLISFDRTTPSAAV